MISTQTISSSHSPEEIIHSLQHWWEMAGVDQHYNEQPSTLLSEKAIEHVPSLSKAVPIFETQPPPAIETQPQPLSPAMVEEIYPSSYRGFLEWLANPVNLVEGKWSRDICLPTGPMSPEIMVISALPERNDSGEHQLFNDLNQKLLSKMLAAIGCESTQTYLASIAVTKPVDGTIEKDLWPQFKARMNHHIQLVEPKQIILLGDLAAKMFFGQDLLTARQKKQNINHFSSKTDAIVTFHPRILIERPQFKAEAWKDLQMLTRISGS